MSFRIMAWVMTFAGSVLGLRFVFAGAAVLSEWGLEVTDAPLVVCRRIGALYLGLALLFFLGRSAAPSDLRSAVCLGVGAASALLACLGLYERSAARVGSRILVPSIIELVLAGGFAWVWWVGR